MATVSEQELVVYGAGGHGTVVLDALIAAGQLPLGFLDDGLAVGERVLGFPVLGDATWLELHAGARVALGVGGNRARCAISERCRTLGVELVTLVHPRAAVSMFAEVGAGSVVLAGSVVNARARLGSGCIVNSGAVVEHDVTVGDFAHVSPNATLTGGASLGTQAQLGAGACVLPGISVGEYALVGAGAVVTRAIPAGCVAFGVPARVGRTRHA